MSKLLSMMMEKQNLIGYTKVGNPTIVDGILTSAGSGNNLQVYNVNLGDKDFEVGCKFKCGMNNCFFYRQRIDGVYFVFYINNASVITFSLKTTSDLLNMSSDNAISENTVYWARVKRHNNVFTMEVSTDGINYIQQINTITNTVNLSQSAIYIGYDGWMTGNGFSGELYLSDCYLKIENKLVFAGTPA